MKGIILKAACLLISMVSSGQTVNVHLKNGQIIEYNASDVEYVDFTKNTSYTSIKAIDLGLSVLWADCNLGADKPEEYGNYYAWGEVKAKKKFTEDNYAHYDSSTNSNKNIGSNISGTQYDAARANLGNGWRMPTVKDFEELINKCTWKWTQSNGTEGYLVTGTNGKTIFMPASGYMTNTDTYQQGKDVRLWSAIEETYQKTGAYSFDGTYTSQYANTYELKFCGIAIRAIKDL